MKDITGQRFGRLVAVEFDHWNERKLDCWLFRCDCGNEKVMPAAYAKWNGVKSCGCLSREHAGKLNRQDITGQRFGRLTAVRPTEDRDVTGSVLWECRCECGSTAYYSVNTLRQRSVKSCGCLYQESRADSDTYRKDLVADTSVSGLVKAKRPRADSTSGCTGVHREKRSGKWTAYINFQKKRYFLGQFDDFESAVQARKAAERRLHDPFVERNAARLTEATGREFEEYRAAAQTAEAPDEP